MGETVIEERGCIDDDDESSILESEESDFDD